MARSCLRCPGREQMIDVGERRLRQRPDRLALDHQHVAAEDFFDADAVVGEARDVSELAVGRAVLAQREQRRVAVGRDDGCGGVHGKTFSITDNFEARSTVL